MSLVDISIGEMVVRDGALYRVIGSVSTSVSDIKSLVSGLFSYGKKSVDGVWLLAFLDANDADNIVVNNGETADKLHLTIAAIDPKSVVDRRDLVTSVVEHMSHGLPSIKGKIGGIGRFVGDGDKVPLVALFDSPSLNDWREQLLSVLRGLGVEFLSDHGYTPHITLAYEDRESNTVVPEMDGKEIELGTLSLVWEGDRRDFQLRGEGEKGGEGSGNFGHHGRPGKRGGSAPSSFLTDSIMDTFFENGGSRLANSMAEAGMSLKQRDMVIKAMTNDPDLREVHVRGIAGISIEEPLGISWDEQEDGTRALGAYDYGTNNMYLNPVLFDDPILLERTLSHEIGHAWEDRLYEDYYRHPGKQSRQAWKNLLSGLVERGYYETRDDERGRTYFLKDGLVERFLTELAGMGLSDYSTTSPHEFFADSFRVYHLGTKAQIRNLSKFVGMDVEEMFATGSL